MTKSELLSLISPKYVFREGEFESLYENVCNYEERWEDIKGYESLYQISTYGKIKTLASKKERIINGSHKWTYWTKEKILSLVKTKKGYLSVGLCREGKRITYLVHRLVAINFIPNDENKPEVNHKYGLKENNMAWNIEWNTHKENMEHASVHKMMVSSDLAKMLLAERNKKRIGNKHHMSKVVLNIETGIFYDTADAAAKSVPMPPSSLYEKINGRKINNTKFIYI